jgi:hypothetical protein
MECGASYLTEVELYESQDLREKAGYQACEEEQHNPDAEGSAEDDGEGKP